MASKDNDVKGERTYGLFGWTLDQLMSDNEHDVYMGSLGREVGAHLREALAELTRLRVALEDAANHFEGQAELMRVACNGPSDAGKEVAFLEAASHIRTLMEKKT